MTTTPRQDAPGPANRAQQQRLAEKLDRDVTAGRAQGAPQPDLVAPFQDGDDHDVGDAYPADQERHRPQPQQERGKGIVGRFLRFQRVRGFVDRDLFGELRVGRGRQDGQHLVHLFRVDPHQHPRGQVLVVEIGLGRAWPIKTERSRSGASSNRFRMPITVNQRSASQTCCAPLT